MDLREVEQQAESLAKQYNPSGLSPFPFESIINSNSDLEVFSVKISESVSGVITYDVSTSKYRIFMNPDKPATRQQFTLAHEIGHYFLHKDIIKSEEGLIDVDGNLDGGNILYRLDEGESTKVEVEANRFAASLIMPKELVEKAWNELKNVEECAKVFNVSVSAMSVRLERLKLLVQ